MATAGVTLWCDDADDWGESRYGYGDSRVHSHAVFYELSISHPLHMLQRQHRGLDGGICEQLRSRSQIDRTF